MEAWGNKPLEDLLLLCDSGTWGDPATHNDGLPILRSTNINRWQLDLSADTAYRRVSQRSQEIFKLDWGDIIVTKSSGSSHLIGQAVIFDIQTEKTYLFSNFTQRLRPNQNLVLPKYLHYYLQSPLARKVIENMHRTTSGLRNLIISDYKKQPIPLPYPNEPSRSLETQHLIVVRLDALLQEVNEARKLQEKIDQNTEELMESVLSEIYTNPENELPDGWEWKSLSEICEINPPRPRLHRKDEEPTSFIPMQALDDVEGIIADMKIRPFGEVKRGYTYFEENDVLFAKITPSMENGKATVAIGLIGGIGFGTTEFHVFHPREGISPDWIYYYIRRKSFRMEAKRHFRGAVGQQRVPEDFLRSCHIPVPYPNDIDRSRNIQRQIVSRFASFKDELGEMHKNSHKNTDLLAQLEQSFLAEAFHGEV